MIDFNKMIDNYLKREHRPKGVGKYYPSEIGICIRKIWYSYKYPQEIRPDLLKIFEVGNILHDFVVNVLKSEKNPEVELLKTEFTFRQDLEEFSISGRVDNLILVKLSGKEVLVEVKSTGDINFVKDAVPHNVDQLQLYMHFTGIHDGILLYIDKKNLNSRIFEIKYTPEEALRLVNRFKDLHKHLAEEKLPDPEARANTKTLWMCRYCEYRERCYAATPQSSRWL